MGGRIECCRESGGWDPREVSSFRTGKSPMVFSRGAGTQPAHWELSGGVGGKDMLEQVWVICSSSWPMKGGEGSAEAPGDMFPGLCDCSLDLRNRAYNMPGARVKNLEKKKSQDRGAWGEMSQIFAQSESLGL